MRIYLKSICRCFRLFPEDEEVSEEYSQKADSNSMTINNIPENNSESLFAVKEVRQRSVEYIVKSPRFGHPSLPDCTGGTDSNSVQ